MNAERDSEARPDGWIFAGLLLVLVWLPLPWGSRSDETVAVTALAVCALLSIWLLLWLGGRVRPASAAARGMAVALWVLWIGWLALQLLPLSCDWLARLSPAALQIHQSAVAAFAAPGTCAPAPLSIAPGLGVHGLLLTGFYFCLYLLVLLTVSSRQRVSAILWTLAGSGLLQALYGLHMTVTGMEYGFLVKKTYGIGVTTGTFVNRDHYAAYLELTLAAGVALVLADLGQWRTRNWHDFLRDLIALLLSAKFRARAMLVAMVAALVLTRSRMGNIAFFASLSVSGGIFTLLRYRKWFIPSLLLFASLLLIDLFVVSRWFGLSAVVERIEQTDLQTETRALVLKDLEPVAQDYLLTGSGLGTFALAYGPYRDESINGYFDHAHNEYAEFLIETGAVGALVLGLLLLVHVWHGVRVLLFRRTPIYAAAAFASLMAIIAMATHSGAEFMLHTPAVAATLVTLMALGMSVSSRSSARRQPGQEDGAPDAQQPGDHQRQ